MIVRFSLWKSSLIFCSASCHQDKFSFMVALDGKTELQCLSFQAPKIRLLRSLLIQNEDMQVLPVFSLSCEFCCVWGKKDRLLGGIGMYNFVLGNSHL